MKYILLLIITISIAIGLYFSFDEYENFKLVTDIKSVSEIPEGNSIVEVIDGGYNIYQVNLEAGFFNIAKRLWLIGFLLIVSIIVLLPLSIIVFKNIFNADISNARQAKEEAENAIKKAKRDLTEAKNEIQKECNFKIKGAYDEQFKIVNKEFLDRSRSLDIRDENVTERENIISTLEENAKIKEEQAINNLQHYKHEFQRLKIEFEEKEKQLIKSRNNAVFAMNRIKNRKGNSEKNMDNH